LRCKVLHTHMIVVVKQTERIPNVVRCLGCPIHKYGGLLGVVVFVVGFSIYFMGQYRQYVQRKGMGPTLVKSRGRLYTASTTEQPFICKRIVCTFSVCGGAIRILAIACIQCMSVAHFKLSEFGISYASAQCTGCQGC